MSIRPGHYFIQSVADEAHFVGTGPVPPVYPPFPAPLRSVREFIKDVFQVKDAGGDKYTLQTHDLWVGYDQDNNVRLMPYGAKPVEWSVNPASEPGTFVFKIPNTDKCWTVLGQDDFAPIRLEGQNGQPGQQWRLVPYSE
ncbi:hypothetical protein RhiLY_09321 [Ceratobasidium sp. AG-Ba]|nr:hypothetical protein RhiLY_09321 [Ceratobasidium sp. AG-Ba]